MARPQRQARASVSYREDHLDEYFGVKQGLAQQVVVEQARAKRTLTLKRSSRTQDRAEAKQLERAISESLTSSCEKTYSRGGLERSARVTNQSRDVQPPLAQLDEGLQSRKPSNAFQFLVDAASADNSTLVGAQTTICDETNKAATSPIVKQQTDSYSTLPAVTAQPCAPQTLQDLQQVNEVGDSQEQLNTSTIQTATAAPTAAYSSHNSEDEWDNEEVGCSDSGNEAKQPVSDKKKGSCRRSIVMTNSDDDEWSAEEESQSDEDEDDGDAFAEDSDDSDCGKGGAKKKRRTAKPAVKKPPAQTLRRGVPTTGALRQGPPSNGKHMSSGLAKEPAIDTRRQKPAGLGQENLPHANVGKISGQAIPTSKLTPSVPAKVTPESRKSLKANGAAVSPASKGLQHSRLPLKPVNISTTKTSIAPTTPATGPPLQFPSTQHRRVLGLSKRFQPPPLHPYLHGT